MYAADSWLVVAAAAVDSIAAPGTASARTATVLQRNLSYDISVTADCCVYLVQHVAAEGQLFCIRPLT